MDGDGEKKKRVRSEVRDEVIGGSATTHVINFIANKF